MLELALMQQDSYQIPASGQFEVQNRLPWEDGVAPRLL
jgi:hypothetical protein